VIARTEASKEIVRLLPAVAMNLRLAALFDLEETELTANQLLTLMLVSSAPEGRMKTGEIAGRLEISLPAATALVDRLVSAGVFQRSQGQDRRVVWVSVTEAGQSLWGRLWTGVESRIDVAIEGMEPDSLDALVEAVRRVATFADRIGERNASRTGGHSSAAELPAGLSP
jgi:DNA-binding MarR family transcriptional regulator